MNKTIIIIIIQNYNDDMMRRRDMKTIGVVEVHTSVHQYTIIIHRTKLY